MVCPDSWAAESEHQHNDWPNRHQPYSYGHNTYGMAGWSQRSDQIRGHWLDDVTMPSSKLEFVDSTHYHVHPWKDTPYAQYGETPPSTTGAYRVLAWRHLYDGQSGFGNVLFFDGHSESLSREELTANPQSKLWQPNQ